MMRPALIRCTRANVTVEFALLTSILMPVAFIGGEKLGPVIRDWSTGIYQETLGARDALADLCQAIADNGGTSTACPEAE